MSGSTVPRIRRYGPATGTIHGCFDMFRSTRPPSYSRDQRSPEPSKNCTFRISVQPICSEMPKNGARMPAGGQEGSAGAEGHAAAVKVSKYGHQARHVQDCLAFVGPVVVTTRIESDRILLARSKREPRARYPPHPRPALVRHHDA